MIKCAKHTKYITHLHGVHWNAKNLVCHNTSFLQSVCVQDVMTKYSNTAIKTRTQL